MSKSTERIRVRFGHTESTDAPTAVRELLEQLEPENAQINLIFTSSRYDLKKLEKEISRSFKSPVIGCTTAGEISARGYGQGGIAAVSLTSEEIEVFSFLIPSLKQLDPQKTETIIEDIKERLAKAHKVKPEAAAFGMLLIDGLSIMEEQVVALLANAVEPIPIVGGSAGDDFKLKQTFIYHDGRFVSDAALFTLFITTLPFVPLKTQHFKASDERLVITKAAPENRIVHEINGLPAAEEYARVIGLELKELAPLVFSEYPVMLRLGGEYYVRSIQRVNADGSLTFFCAIDEGLVLRVATGENLVNNLDEAFQRIRQEVPNIKLTIGFDCILRLLEVQYKDLQEGVNELFKKNCVVGFNTYGEQFNSVHVNQTFTGIVLGE